MFHRLRLKIIPIVSNNAGTALLEILHSNGAAAWQDNEISAMQWLLSRLNLDISLKGYRGSWHNCSILSCEYGQVLFLSAAEPSEMAALLAAAHTKQEVLIQIILIVPVILR